MFYEIAVCDDDSAFAAELAARLDRALEAKGVDGRVTTFSDPEALRRAVTGGAAVCAAVSGCAVRRCPARHRPGQRPARRGL